QIKDEGLKPWSITRIYLRHFAPQGATITIDVSMRDNLGGLSPSEIGAFALSRHYSQGMLRTLKAGERELRYFSVLKSRIPTGTKTDSLLDAVAAEAGVFNQSKSIAAIAHLVSPQEL